MPVRIGIIGTDGGSKSGHAVEICRIIADKSRDAYVAAIYGEDTECTRELYETGTVKRIAETPEEMLPNIDAVMILNRDGRKHMKYAMPFLEKGIPTFIDKPLACSIQDALRIKETSEKNNTLLMGGSYMKYASGIIKMKEEIKNIGKILSGYFSFPIFLNSEHGGLHFYSHHLIEEMLTVFGKDAEYISTSLTKGKLVATAHYPEFPVIMNYAVAYPAFYGAAYGTKGSVTEKLSADGLDAVQIDLFIKAVQSGTAEDSCGNLLSAVRLSCAIERSIRENRAVKAEL